MGWLSTGDQIASIVGAAAGVLALIITLRQRRVRRRKAATAHVLTELARAQAEVADRHRYHFFDRHPPALLDVYVRRRLQAARQETADSARPVRVAEVLAGTGHALVVGGAGAGKSALVAAIIADGARGIIRDRGRPAVHVVMVRASDLVGRRLPEAIAEATTREFKVVLEPQEFARPPAPGRRWRILIDGLDEIFDARARGEVLGRLRAWVADPAQAAQFLITSRPLAADEMMILRHDRLVEYELRSFDREELGRFADKWFLAREPHDLAAARDRAARFVARIAGARLGPVARVPLLASIAAIVYEQADGGALPTSRSALYERFIDHLLDGRGELTKLRDDSRARLTARGQAGEDLADWLDADFYAVLHDLLDTAGAAAVDDVDADITAIACARLAERAPADLTRVLPDGVRFVRDVLLATGVFVVRGQRLAFAHQSFAEFFAARGRAAAFDERVWRKQVTDPATRSLAAFAAARRPDAGALLADLAKGPRPDPAAAGFLLADGVPVGDATRSVVIDALVAEFRRESMSVGECLTVLRELAVEADVFARLQSLAAEESLNPWTRAIVADAVAEVDRAAGVALLSQLLAAADIDDAVRTWTVDALQAHGGRLGESEWVALRIPLPGAPRPLSSLARHTLTQLAQDSARRERERLAAAVQLATDGEPAPLRALAEAPEVAEVERLQAAVALAGHGDRTVLIEMARSAGLSVRYAAAIELHAQHAPEANEILRTVMADGWGRPLSYGAAARLADRGDLEPLIRLATGDVRPRQLGLAAARRLAVIADEPALAQLANAPDADVRAVALTNLPHGTARADAAINLLVGERIRWRSALGLAAALAGAGDLRARSWLRRPDSGVWQYSDRPGSAYRRLYSAFVLAGLQDPVGAHRIERLARSRLRNIPFRVLAAVQLVAVDADRGLRLLEWLAAPGRRVPLRLAAATAMAYRFQRLDPLVQFVTDPRLGTGRRVEAFEYVRRAGGRTALTETEDLITVPVAGRLLAADFMPVAPTMPEADMKRIAALARSTATPARLRIAAATAALQAPEAADVLAAIAAEPRNGVRARSIAAARLADLDPGRGIAAQRALVADTGIPRPLRWLVLIDGNLFELSEFAEQRALVEDLDAGWRLPLRILRLATVDPSPRPAKA